MKRALLVIDVQNEYFGGNLPVVGRELSLANILKGMEAAGRNHLPVIVVQHSAPQPDSRTFCKGTAGWELLPQIAERGWDLLIEKQLPGSFTGTNLEAWLRRHDIDTVAVSGYMSQMCCDTTARQAVHLGFQCEFLSDATGTLDITNAAGSITAADLHRAVLITQAMRFSDVVTTNEWIKRIGG